MTPSAAKQLEYFQSRMSTTQDLRAWRHHYQHRAEVLEETWPVEYAGLALALEEWVKAQMPKKEKP